MSEPGASSTAGGWMARAGELALALAAVLLLSVALCWIRPGFERVVEFDQEALPVEMAASFFSRELDGQRSFYQSRPVITLPLYAVEGSAQLELSFANYGQLTHSLTLGEHQIDEIQPQPGYRRYLLLLPASRVWYGNSFRLSTAGFAEQGESQRRLGVAVDRFALRPLALRQAPLIEPRLALRVLLLGLCWYGWLQLAPARARRRLLAAAALAALLLLATRSQHNLLFTLLLSGLLAGSLLASALLLLFQLAERLPRAALLERARARLPRAAQLAEPVFWLLAAALMTYPTIATLDSALPTYLDSYLISWILAWDHHQLWHSPLQLYDANIFYPYPMTLAHSEHLLGLYPLTGPLFALGLSPATVHNLTLLLSFALCGYGTSLLARRLSGSLLAGIAAGLIYAFYPYRLEQIGHLQLAAAHWLPFAMLMLERFRSDGRWRDAILWGVFSLLHSLVSYYHAVFYLVLLVIYGLYFLARDPAFRQPGRLARLAMIGLLVGLVHLPLIYPYMYNHGQLGFERQEWEAEVYSARLLDYAIPAFKQTPYRLTGQLLSLASPGQSSYLPDRIGEWVQTPTSPEGKLFPGFLALGLAGAGLIGQRQRPIVWCLALMLLVCVVLGLGPGLRLREVPGLYDPAVVEPMPFSFLGIEKLVRVPARFALAMILPLALLAAFGIAALLRWLRERGRRAAPLALALLLLLGAELIDTPRHVIGLDRDTSGVNTWLAQQPPGLVLHLPLTDNRVYAEALPQVRHIYFGIAHFFPMMNGYSGSPDLPAYAPLRAAQARALERPLLQLLQGLGLRYLVVHDRNLSAEQWQELNAELLRQPELSQRLPGARATVFELRADPWADEIAGWLAGDKTLYVARGGSQAALMPLLALRFHSSVTAGETLLGYRQLGPPPQGTLPDFALLGAEEDPAPAGYREADVIWRNELFKLIRRPE